MATPEDTQVVVFLVDGMISRLTSGMYMPHLHTFVNHGIWDIHSRGDISHSDPKIGWISSLFGISPVQYGCDPMHGCGTIAPEVSDPYNIFDVLTDTLEFQANIFSENPDYTTSVIGDVYSVRKFTSRVKHPQNITDDLVLTATGDRLVVFHLKELVTTGFSDGWASSNYLGQISCLDYEIMQLTLDLWDYSPNKTTFILLSDRGGHRFSNQNFHLDTAQIVFSAWGYGVKQPPNINQITVNPTQIPKTILAMVDPDYEINAPAYWNSEVLANALQPDPAHHFNLSAVVPPNNPPVPQCIIPNIVDNETVKIVSSLVYIVFFILITQIIKFRHLLTI